ncbi:MAG TPA: DUF502 domain-containing protein [Thermoanaerobaculia bacterium]|nr:DUF502 domain-containing protein [Thermoanaerobaculia bacterium]
MSAVPGLEPPAHPHSPSWRHRFRTVLLAGLLFVAPVFLTIYVLRVLFLFMDGIFAPLIDRTLRQVFPESAIHIPGLGILLTLAVVLFLGWLSTNLVGRRLLDSVEAFFLRVPVVKSVYGATKGVLEAVSHDQAEAFKRVVLVEYPRLGVFSIGFVTGAPSRWPMADPRADEELVPVLIPRTPNPLSGYIVLLPPRQLIECAITVEEGVRMVVSGGILPPESIQSQLRSPRSPLPEAAEKELEDAALPR